MKASITNDGQGNQFLQLEWIHYIDGGLVTAKVNTNFMASPERFVMILNLTLENLQKRIDDHKQRDQKPHPQEPVQGFIKSHQQILPNGWRNTSYVRDDGSKFEVSLPFLTLYPEFTYDEDQELTVAKRMNLVKSQE